MAERKLVAAALAVLKGRMFSGLDTFRASLRRRIVVILVLACLTALTCGVFVNWVDTPFDGDQRVFFAAARQADYLGNFPLNVYRSWELKPLGHRVVVYSMYRAATLFVDFHDKIAFERGVRIAYAIVISLVGFFFALSLGHLFQGKGLIRVLLLLMGLISFFSASYALTLQAEEVSVLFLMAAVPLALAKSRALNLLSGLPLAALFTLKGVTVLLGLQIPIVLYILGATYRKNLVWCVAGFIGWFAVIMGILLLIFPQDLRDLYNATLFQNPFALGLRRFTSLRDGFLNQMHHAPIIMAGAVSAWLALPIFMWYRQRANMLAFMCLFALSAAVVLVQAKFYEYAYAVFVLPSLISVVLLNRMLSDTDDNLSRGNKVFLVWWGSGLLLLLAILFYIDRYTPTFLPLHVVGYNMGVLAAGVVMVLVWLLVRRKGVELRPLYGAVIICFAVVLVGAIWARYQSPWGLHRWGRGQDDRVMAEVNQRVFGELRERYQLSGTDKVLFIDDGQLTYYFDSPTYCRYFTNIPLSRAYGRGSPKLRYSAVFRETWECTMSYQGEYIIGSPKWISLDGVVSTYPALVEKIAREYKVVAESNETRPKVLILQRRHSSITDLSTGN